MHEDKIEKLAEIKKLAEIGGGEERIKAQHSKGKLTARERLNLLLDPGTFIELDKFVVTRSRDFGLDKKKFYGDGVVTGYGNINNRQVFVYAQDFTVLGGSLGEMSGKKIAKVMDHAIKNGCPIIGIIDSGGARIQEGVMSLAGYGEIFYRNTLASGVVPQITINAGPCAGGAVYSPAITDFIIMIDKISHMFVTGPEVVKTALGEDVTFEELGGAQTHGKNSGVAHFVASDEYEAMDIVKRLLSYIPQNNMEDPPYVTPTDDPNRMDSKLANIIPANPYEPYDIKEIITSVLDNNEFFEVHELWAQNVVVGFGRLNGRSVGIIANQPQYLAGSLDIDSSCKAARFIRFCDCFNIPIISFVDTPGYLPGLEQERHGIIRHGSKLLFAYCEATVPKLAVIVGKAYGGAYIAMSSKHLRTDMNFAWPTAEIAVLGPEAAINIIFRKDIAEADDKEAVRKKLIEEYRAKFAHPYIAAEQGYIDAVIDPIETRPMLIRALESVINKKESRPFKKHGNINL
ncbi:MAG: methylmalonyl-CoA carboxyltransferase [Candidatus Nitrosocaldaceae archaeon]|nr:MAG: methylmalonyl-CoA carboxyltransferase [Candidatus Nitrosocaldaceae archaeon]